MNFTDLLGNLIPKAEDDWYWIVLKILGVVAVGIVLAVRGVQGVASGEVALKTRWKKVVFYRKDKLSHTRGQAIMRRNGKPLQIGGYTARWLTDNPGHLAGTPIVRQAGLFIAVPFVHNLIKTSNQERIRPVGELVRQINGYQFWTEEVQVSFRVDDPYRALILFQDVEGQVTALIKEYAQIAIKDNVSNAYLSDHVLSQAAVQERAQELGVEIYRLILGVSGQTPQSQLAAGLQSSDEHERVARRAAIAEGSGITGVIPFTGAADAGAAPAA